MKRYPSQTVLFASLLGTGLWCSPSAHGLGIAVPDQDAFATARGNAFVATADDPAAVFYNPAGISQLTNINLSLGAYGIVYGSSFKSGATEVDTKTQLQAAPQVFVTYPLEQYPLAFGLGFYSPYGFRVEWPDRSIFPPGGLGQVTYYTVNPVVSCQVLPSLSLAAGFSYNYSEAHVVAHPGFLDEFRGRDSALGYNLGVLWHPLEQHSFGVTYRSGTVMNYTGHATQVAEPGFPEGPASARFHFPQTVDFGYSFRPTHDWNIEADAEWTDWSSLKSVPVTGQPPLLFNWQASWIISAGVTRYLGHGWRVSGGYMYSENSAPSTDFNDLIPDSDRHVFSAGVGKDFGHFSCDAAYQFGWSPSRTVSGDVASPTANGNYAFISHALTLNVGYHF